MPNERSAHQRAHYPLKDRQLTLGECIAINRYALALLDDKDSGRLPLAELLEFIDRIKVCTTCGWSRAIHENTLVPHTAMGLCAHYERHL